MSSLVTERVMVDSVFFTSDKMSPDRKLIYHLPFFFFFSQNCLISGHVWQLIRLIEFRDDYCCFSTKKEYS